MSNLPRFTMGLAAISMVAILLATTPAAAQLFTGNIESQKLSWPDAGPRQEFGHAVAVDGDTMVISAPIDSGSASYLEGSVIAFTRENNEWEPDEFVGIPTDPNASSERAEFGWSLAVEGDMLAVGAPGTDSNSGSVYVFTREFIGNPETNWIFSQRLQSTDPQPNFRFGSSVAIDNGILVIGAQNDGLAGAAYVYEQTKNVFVQQARLAAPDGETGDTFGRSVAINGGTILIGAPGDDVRRVDQGSVRVFSNSDDGWNQEQVLTPSNGLRIERFGVSVAIDGDHLVVGAPFRPSGASQREGAVYFYSRTDTTWGGEQQVLVPDNKTQRFGRSVDIQNESVVIGTGDGSVDGSVHLYSFDGNEWSQQIEYTASDTQNNQRLGFAVALDGDTIVAGAPNDEDFGFSAGAAYVFDSTQTQPLSYCNNLVVTVILAAGDLPTTGDDVILGTSGPDVINAGAGNDTICAGGGDDTINAGNGADTVFAGEGGDTIQAGQGRDIIDAGDGDDFVSGGKGKDTIDGGAGNDDLRGNEGTDTINGGAGNDELRGGQKADVINGGNGNDNLIGGTRPDVLNGGIGLDTYNGGGGADTCANDPDGLTEQTTNCEVLSF